MAHAAKIQELSSSLITSITGRGQDDTTFKPILRDTVKNLIKSSSHGRTNQFDINARLEGLVEKFAVLNREDLSNELQDRLDELPAESRWLPEVLSLLLQLSDRPLEKTKLEDLHAVECDQTASHELTWREIFSEGPPDDSGLWDNIERGYHSSGDEDAAEEEDLATSTDATSVADDDLAGSANLYVSKPDLDLLGGFQQARIDTERSESGKVTVTELKAIRESIHMLQGLPTRLFKVEAVTRIVSPNWAAVISTASALIVQDVLQQFGDIGTSLTFLRYWLRMAHPVHYVQSCQTVIQQMVSDLTQHLAGIERKYISPSTNVIVSVIDVRTEVEAAMKPLLRVSALVRQPQEASAGSPFALLESLYDEVCMLELSGDEALSKDLARILIAGLWRYLKPVVTWIRTGKILDSDHMFFVVEGRDTSELCSSWHDRFALRRQANEEPFAPRFLLHMTDRIFRLGKSRAFLRELEHDDYEDEGVQYQLPDLSQLAQRSTHLNLVPFSQRLSDILESWLNSIGEDYGPLVCQTLLNRHGLLDVVNELGTAFYGQDARLFQTFADTLFWRMDKRSDWRDDFLLTELAQTIFGGAGTIAVDTLTITTLREQSQVERSCFGKLKQINLTMIYPSLIQNITCSRSPEMASKAFALLLQVYRAKYLLRQQMRDLRTLDSRTTQLPPTFAAALRLRQALIAIVNVFYDHVTGTTSFLLSLLRDQLIASSDVDAMVRVWGEHEKSMQSSLLLSHNMAPLRDTVADLLELSERFATIWTTLLQSAELQDSGSSFTSRAVDHKPPHTLSEAPSALSEMRSNMDRSLPFLISGLRNTSRATGDTTLEALADRLDWRATS